MSTTFDDNVIVNAAVGIETGSPLEALHANGNVRLGSAPATATTINQIGGINNTDTSVTVVSTSGYPATGTLLIEVEAMTYSGLTATTFTGLTRGVLGTSAVSHINA